MSDVSPPSSLAKLRAAYADLSMIEFREIIAHSQNTPEIAAARWFFKMLDEFLESVKQ